MDIIDRLLLKSYTSLNNSNYRVIRTFSIALMLLTTVLLVVLIMGAASPATLFLVGAIILFNSFILILIQMGYFRLSIPLLLIGLGILTTLIVFSISKMNHFEIYMLTTFHLSLLFISTLISYRMIYAYIAAGFALCAAILHYVLREIPNDAGGHIITSNFDDYIICMGLIIMSCIIFNNTLKYRIHLFSEIRKQSKDNLGKVKKISLINDELNLSINEKKKAEDKYRLLVETAIDAIFIAQEGVVKFPNKKTVEMTGYSPRELSNIPFIDFIHAGDKPRVLKRHHMRLKGEEPPGNYTFRFINKKEEVLWVQLNTVFTLWDEKPATLNIMRDVTDQKKLEAQFQQSQKMEAIGTLAGGIAHDFNNILSGIFAFSQLAKKHTEDPEKLNEYIGQIEKAAHKAADLVQQILTVSRKSIDEKQPTQVYRVVKEALKLIRATIPTTIDIVENIESKAIVMSDSAKIHQIIMNLCTNAYHSMAENGGTLSIHLTETHIREKNSIPEFNIIPGDYLMLKISDTGKGMDLRTQSKIFEPYFTTKEKGKGTGMGLAVAHGIIEEHKGHINVYSEPGQGSCFKVLLPITKEKITPDESVEEEKSVTGGTETIMFVDDEESILLSVRDLLGDYGYHVSSFLNGVQALAEYKKNPEKYDLVITDMTMPQITGIELINKIFELKPDQPVFLCTGHSESVNKEKANAMGILQYFEKPIETKQLLQSIRDVFNS